MQLNYNEETRFNDVTEVRNVKGGTVISVDPGTGTNPSDPENIYIVGDKEPTSVTIFSPRTGDMVPVARNKRVRILEGCLHYRECQSQKAVDRALKG